MPLETYHFNLTTRKWVKSADDPSPIDGGFPVFGNTDTRDFAVRFLVQTSATAVEVVTSVVSAQIAISDPATPGTVITSATAGTADNNYFPFVLPISGFTTFLSGVTSQKLATCEFRIATASGVNRYRTSVYISPNQTADAVADPTVADRAVGFEEMKGLVLMKQVPRYTVLEWPDEDTGVVHLVRLKGGQLRADQT